MIFLTRLAKMGIFYWLAFYVNRAKFEWARGARDGYGKAATSKEGELIAILKGGDSGTYISAIKRYRELYGAPLKEAKDGVDAIISKHGLPHPYAGNSSYNREKVL